MMDVATVAGLKRFDRRLSDKLMLAFEQACDAGLEESAAVLLQLIEEQIYRENTYPGRDRRNPNECLASAQLRLASLRTTSTGPTGSHLSALGFGSAHPAEGQCTVAAAGSYRLS